MKYIKNTKKVFKVTPILLSVSFWLLVASVSLLLWGGNDLQAQEGQQAGQQARKTGWLSLFFGSLLLGCFRLWSKEIKKNLHCFL